jgi:predicted O-methyltransferase YrrM
MMVRRLCSAFVIVIACAVSAHAQGAVPPAIDAILKEIRRADTGQLAVSEADGQFLRMLAVATGTKRALEIGAASGYSAIWLGLAMRDTGGTLVTIEYDAARAREAAANIKRAGLSDVVQVVQGDAFAEIPKVAGTFDFVFLDAWKKDYQRFFSMVFPRMTRGGVLLAHNVINKRDEMPDFLQTIHTHPDVLTSIVSAGFEGISVTVKRR